MTEPGEVSRPDLVANQRQSRDLRAVLEEQGLKPERMFNATHGARRLLANLLGELVADAGARARIAGRIGAITGARESAPKTIAWRMRARVGRRVRWYEVPEEVVR
jgi:hypothetical protein